MIECPICPDRPPAKIDVGTNCFQCSTCDELIFAVRNPFDTTSVFPAFSNASSQFRSIPNDALLHMIVDQSPVDDSPRNMLIELADGATIIMIQVDSGNFRYSKNIRTSLNKTANALKHDVLYTQLPVELMERIRTANSARNE